MGVRVMVVCVRGKPFAAASVGRAPSRVRSRAWLGEWVGGGGVGVGDSGVGP